ncbi:hypothetical protein [Paraburkholderia sp.]|uniref:hypothetical protein n=1 Tax=Paraburkholderia sp. TaxID=1926495 RepID=UPI003C7A4A1E
MPDAEFVQQPAAQLVLSKIRDPEQRSWYVGETLEHASADDADRDNGMFASGQHVAEYAV